VGDAEDFARSLRMTLALLEDIRSHVTAAQADSEAAVEQLAEVLLGSTNTLAEAVGTAAALDAGDRGGSPADRLERRLPDRVCGRCAGAATRRRLQ
jgi:hypothetical protein